MDPDLILIIGIVLVVFSVPSIAGAFSHGHAPRVAALGLVAGGILVIWAINRKPGGYSVLELPDVFMSVVGRLLS